MIPTVVVHAGAGAWDKPRDAAEAACQRAVAAGLSVLDGGGSAVDAAIAAVVVLEDDPACNAGTGAVPTSAGTYELDACVADGAARRSGAVTCLSGWANPIDVARSVLDDGRFHLLAGAGAAAFATEHGHPADGLVHAPPGTDPSDPADRGNTVGAVALDRSGRLAAATSTGGVPGQLPGRVGDTPIVGAGTFADGRAACSCTGDGESFARACTAFWAVDRAGGAPCAEVADAALARTRDEWGGTGGLILLAAGGEMAIARTTPAMAHAWGRIGGPITVGR